jgi:hypothetical protein
VGWKVSPPKRADEEEGPAEDRHFRSVHLDRKEARALPAGTFADRLLPLWNAIGGRRQIAADRRGPTRTTLIGAIPADVD